MAKAQRKPTKTLSIIIVHYGFRKNLFDCLTSIYKNKPKNSFEVVVVDNDEKERIKKGLKSKFPKVKYIKPGVNLGYGAGNNLGIKNSTGKYIFVLNPDTKLFKNSVDNLISYLDKNKQAAVVAPNLVDRNKEVFPQRGSSILTPLKGVFALSFLNKIFPNNKFSRDYYLKDENMKKIREVSAVPGSAFLIRRDVFEEIGGYDEKFFLYFEESDLGKRIQEAGYKLFVVSTSRVMHYWKEGREEDKSLKKIFNQSRFYYFRKHHGLLQALIVEAFANFSKYYAALILIIILAALLRFHRINENLVFHGELGDNYLKIKTFIQNKQIPLIGPPTSHPWLAFSPLFYWIFAPILAIFKFTPLAGAYFFASVNLVLIVVNFWTIKNIFNEKVALISCYLIAISPLWMDVTRESRFFSLSIIFLYPFLYLISNNVKKYFLIGLLLGLSLSFHLTPLFLIPFVLIIMFINKNLNIKSVSKFILGLLITQIPFLIYEATHKFEMIIKFVEWLPYRTLSAQKTVYSNIFYEFITRSFVAHSQVSAIIFIFFVILLAYLTLIFYKKKSSPIFILVSWFYLGLLALFLHGNPPSHYLMPLYFVPIILVSYQLSKLNKYVLIIFLTIVTFINLKFYFSSSWFYIPQNLLQINRPVPFSIQQKLAKAIVKDANGQRYNLKRVGFSDQFEDNYAQNYEYLLWLQGNEPSKSPEKLEYTIIENPPNISVTKDEK